MDQELADADADVVYALPRWQHFSAWNDAMIAINVWRSNKKSDSVNRCAFTQRTIVLNFTPIRFEMTEP